MNETTKTLDSEQGKEVLENLLKTLSPEKAEELKKALNGPNPPHIHIDESKNVFIGADADRAIEMRGAGKKDEPAKVTKIDQKRVEAFKERCRRWLNKNPGKTDQDAIRAMQLEDYERMPLDQKVKRLESLLAQSISQMGQDLLSLRHNQYAIADAYELNYRGMAKMLAKLGITPEEHKKFMDEANAEFLADQKAAMQKHLEESKKAEAVAAEKTEVKAMNDEAKEVSKPGAVAEGSAVPEGATVFGG